MTPDATTAAAATQVEKVPAGLRLKAAVSGAAGSKPGHRSGDVRRIGKRRARDCACGAECMEQDGNVATR
jgi:hypothetical protein